MLRNKCGGIQLEMSVFTARNMNEFARARVEPQHTLSVGRQTFAGRDLIARARTKTAHIEPGTSIAIASREKVTRNLPSRRSKLAESKGWIVTSIMPTRTP
jgi:hypothetical protein